MAQAGAPFPGANRAFPETCGAISGRLAFGLSPADRFPAARRPSESSASVHDPGAAAVARRFAPSWFPALPAPPGSARIDRDRMPSTHSAPWLCNFPNSIAQAHHLDEGLTGNIALIPQFSMFVKKLFLLCSFGTRAVKRLGGVGMGDADSRQVGRDPTLGVGVGCGEGADNGHSKVSGPSQWIHMTIPT